MVWSGWYGRVECGLGACVEQAPRGRCVAECAADADQLGGVAPGGLRLAGLATNGSYRERRKRKKKNVPPQMLLNALEMLENAKIKKMKNSICGLECKEFSKIPKRLKYLGGCFFRKNL